MKKRFTFHQLDNLGEAVVPQTTESIETEAQRLDRLMAGLTEHLSHIAENTSKTASDIAEMKALQAARQSVEIARQEVEDTLATAGDTTDVVTGAGAAVPAVVHDSIDDTSQVIEAPKKKKKRTKLW